MKSKSKKWKIQPTFYESMVKPTLDKILSFFGLFILCPLYVVIALIVYLDDPGPVLFTQKRIGKDKHFFMLHKFRTMKISTPHDVPTHQLEHPEQYLTKAGKVLRRTSLDELPQIWDILRGKMSIIGPRPALWNQDDLVAEREKYGANSILPGLTGFAQIHGRDELEIEEKAKLDGEYANALAKGGIYAFATDIRCFLGTITSVLKHDGVVEGGTGVSHGLSPGTCGYIPCKIWQMKLPAGKKIDIPRPDVPKEDLRSDWGFKKKFNIDYSRKVKVLITGKSSYIGKSLESYARKYYPSISVDTISMKSDGWKECNFSIYDCVFHVAGIAHVDTGKASEADIKQYYMVNTDLAIATAKKAKDAGVRQFVFMSTMIIYGSEKYIDESVVPSPDGFYGDSKWQADRGVRALGDEKFHVAVIRSPMVYGKGSKGNYPVLAKLAKIMPLFPEVSNCRSMIYIENLTEFLCGLILSGEDGIYMPQNEEYSNTGKLVKMIGKAAHKPVFITKILTPIVGVGMHTPGKGKNLIQKAFGSSCYDQRLSHYDGFFYQKYDLEESINRTEGFNIWKQNLHSNCKKSVLLLVNHDVVIYNFRLELVERLVQGGYEVHVSSPYGERIDDLVALGVKYHEIMIDRHGINPLGELFILREYKRLIAAIHPVIVFGYTIKPNIYGAIASRICQTPFAANITGLGTAVGNSGWQQKLTVEMYRLAFGGKKGKIQRVFFQNEENKQFFIHHNIALNKHELLPGSGVNLRRYIVKPYPECGDGKSGKVIRFAFISRIMKEKGIEEYLLASEIIKQKFPLTEFHVAGFAEMEYEGRLEELNAKGIVIYHGMVRDVARLMSEMNCIVHPTYYPEGLSNVLLEASACGRPVITTDRSGCREICKEGVNGYLVGEREVQGLIAAIEKFINLPQDKKEQMGVEGRKLVEEKFDRKIVVEAYMKELEKA